MAADRKVMQRFGRKMARTRKLADVKQDALARDLGVSPSHISNLERGYRSPVPSFLPKLDKALGAGEKLTRLWNELTGSGRQAWLEEVTTLVREAAAVMDYQNAVFPGLLQTEDYAHELISAGMPWATSDVVRAAVADRAARARTFEEATAPLLWVVLDGMIIKRRFVTENARRGQLEHVVKLVEAGRVSVQIIPEHYLGHPGLTGPFKVITPSMARTWCTPKASTKARSSQLRRMWPGIAYSSAGFRLLPWGQPSPFKRFRENWNMSEWRKSSYSNSQGGNRVEVADWRKSSYSGATNECVEVGELERGRAVRDSKNPGLGFLAFDAPEWRAFLSALRAGELAG